MGYKIPSILFVCCLSIFFMAGCGVETKEVFTINPDLSGKCVVDARMVLDTSGLSAKLAAKDSMYGIIPAVPDYHKKKFTRRDLLTFALRIIKTKGVEVWNNINFGISKKKDVIYFSGTAYFRDISKVRFSMLDSVLQVTHELGSKITFRLEPNVITPSNKLPDDTINKKVSNLRQNAFYERPVLADILNHSETDIIYNLPGDIVKSSIFDQDGDNIVKVSLTGNEILKYGDSLSKNQDLAVKEFKATNGTCANVLEPLFNRVAFGTGVPMEVTFNKGTPLFDYNGEVQSAIIYFDNFMEQSKLEKFDSTSALKEEREEDRRPAEYGKLIVNKMDSQMHKTYFSDMTCIQSHDTLTVSGELSQDVKADEYKVHIMKIIAGIDQDITDSIVDRNKIHPELSSEQGDNNPKGPKRKMKFICIVHFPPACKEISLQGRLSTTLSGKPGVQIPFKMKQVAVSAKSK